MEFTHLTMMCGSVEELREVAASVKVMVCGLRDTDQRVMPCTSSSPADMITCRKKHAAEEMIKYIVTVNE